MREKLVLLAVAAVGSGLLALAATRDAPPAVRAAEGPRGSGVSASVAESVRTGPERDARPRTELSVPVPPAIESPAAAAADSVPAPAPTPDLEALFDALRHDAQRWNATNAAGRLGTLLGDPVWGPAVLAGAEARLFSDDEQQRDLVTQLLIGATADGGETDTLHPVVLERALGWLAGAPYPFLCYLTPSAQDARALCALAVEQVEPELVGLALDPDDPAHWPAIEVLAVRRRPSTLDLYAPALVERLADNAVQGDALRSAWLLKRLGPPALPYLGGPYRDAQQADLARMVRAEIARPGGGRPGESRSDLTPRAPFGPVTDWSPRDWLRRFAR